MSFRFREDRPRKHRPFLRYLFGGDDSSSAPPDGYGLVTKRSHVEFRPVIYEIPPSTSEVNGMDLPPKRHSPIPISPKAKSPPPEVYQLPVAIYEAAQRPLSGAFESVHSQGAYSSRSSRMSQQLLIGCQAPTSSPMTDLPTRSPTIIPHSPLGMHCSSPSTPKPDTIDSIPWEDFEIPVELEILRHAVPEVIRNIVLESLNERRALRASRLQQEAIGPSIRNDESSVNQAIDEQENIEHSTDPSMHTSPSEYRGSESTQSMSSATTVGSEIEDGSIHRLSVNPPTNQALNRRSATLSPQMAQVEYLLQQSKARTAKSRKLFKILPTSRKSQGRPNTPEAPAQIQSPTNAECTSCFDDIPAGTAVTGLACNHKYCPLCFTQLILTSTHSESTFPPKCCLLEIPTPIIRSTLSPQDNAAYDQKALEYAVPIADRYYCPRTSCARWVDTRLAQCTNDGLACPHCRHKICSVCRGPSHPSNQDCPQDYGLSSTLEQAEEAGWQRCFQCRTLVERNQGCRHITCSCGGEFCYTCGQRWRTCSCTEADQARLDKERATRAAQRRADALREEEEVRAAIAAVERAEQQLAEERAEEERRVAEEAAELVRREEERVARVQRHFEHLREVLDTVQAAQRIAIQARHHSSQADLKQQQEQRVRDLEREIRDEADFLAIEGKRMLEMLQRKHVHATLETLARHRAHQDALHSLDLSHAVSRNPYQVARQTEALKAVMLQALLPTQELERVELKAQQAREIGKWRSRTERTVKTYDVEGRCEDVRRSGREQLRETLREEKRRETAEAMWCEILGEERVRMLREDEGRFVACGAEAPEEEVMPLPSVEDVVAKKEEAEDGDMAQEQGVERRLPFSAEITGDADGGGGGGGDLSDHVRARGWGPRHDGTSNTLGLGLGLGLGVRVEERIEARSAGREIAATGA